METVTQVLLGETVAEFTFDPNEKVLVVTVPEGATTSPVRLRTTGEPVDSGLTLTVEGSNTTEVASEEPVTSDESGDVPEQ